MKTERAKVKIIPLGGIDEIGKNLTVIEYKEDIVIVDCGLKFPDVDMYGVDIVIPDISYLVKKQDIQLSFKETQIIEFVDTEIRPKRNDLTHKRLPFSKKQHAEEILKGGDITKILQSIELEHRYNKDTVLWFIKQFFNIIDNKIT